MDSDVPSQRSDADRTLDIIGAAILLALVVGIAIAVLAAINAPDLRADPPATEWELERVNETHVRIVHAGGEPVAARNLTVQVGQYERSVGWEGVLVSGDAGIVRARRDEPIQLVWRGGRGDRVRLARWPAETTTSK